MKIVIPGGTGQLGRLLTRGFRARGDEVVVLGRGASAPEGARFVAWDGRTVGADGTGWAPSSTGRTPS